MLKLLAFVVLALFERKKKRINPNHHSSIVVYCNPIIIDIDTFKGRRIAVRLKASWKRSDF